MNNIEKLKEYLVGSKGYLLNDKLSNGKVIMLSGAWGSGKTHFWDNEIREKLDKNIYISLYGKKSILDIENEVLTKSILKELPDDNKIVENLSLFGSITKNIANIFVPNSGEKLEDIKNKLINSFGKNSLKEGVAICFDDFERKSQDIDLNDLFGFITQLATSFKCKVVIILNSDVFEGKEKEIFTTVKEKSVSKYLMFNPTCDELFEIIFKDDSYQKLIQHKDILKTTFADVGIVNARIFIQVLDNWLEWVNKKNFNTDFYLRYFVLTNINFILNHHIFEAKLAKIDRNIIEWDPNNKTNADYYAQTSIAVKSNINFELIESYISKANYQDRSFNNLKIAIQIAEQNSGILDMVNQNESLVKSLHFMKCFGIYKCRESNNQVEVDILNEINSFIETGMIDDM